MWNGRTPDETNALDQGPFLGRDQTGNPPLPPSPADRPSPRPTSTLDLPPAGTNAIVFGIKGFGKSRLVQSLLADQSRCLILDLQREHGNVAVRITNPVDLAEFLEGRRSWRVSYYSTDLKRQFDALCEAVWQMGTVLLVVEEVHNYCSPSFIPEPFERITLFGRHGDNGPVSTICVSRRPAEVNRAITSEAWDIYSFNVSEPSALEYLAKYVSPDFVDGLNKLPPLRYRRYNRLNPLAGIEEKELPDPRKGKPSQAVERGA